MSKRIEEMVEKLVGRRVLELGYELVDVEYAKVKGQDDELVVYIDKEGGVNINDCEAISRRVSDLLDEADPIQGSYVLEVGSAGADRALKKPEHFAQCMGQEVDVKLYRPREGRKEFTGTLAGYDQGNVTVTQPDGAEVVFEKKEIALVRLHLDF